MSCTLILDGVKLSWLMNPSPQYNYLSQRPLFGLWVRVPFSPIQPWKDTPSPVFYHFPIYFLLYFLPSFLPFCWAIKLFHGPLSSQILSPYLFCSILSSVPLPFPTPTVSSHSDVFNVYLFCSCQIEASAFFN